MAFDGCGKIIYSNKNITEYVFNNLGERCVTVRQKSGRGMTMLG
jgi:hypothetical protein